MQHRAAVEVHPAQLTSVRPGRDLVPGVAGPVHDVAGPRQHPLASGLVHVDGHTAERLAPLDHRAVGSAGATRRSPGDPAERAHRVERSRRPRWSTQSHRTLPALARHEQRALPDERRRVGADAVDAAVALRPNHAPVPLGGRLGRGGPPLAAPTDVLPFVGADAADVGRLVVLDAAGPADRRV